MKRFLTTVLTVILTIVLLAGAAAGFILYRKYKPSKEQVDQNEWYQASGDEMALFLDSVLVEGVKGSMALAAGMSPPSSAVRMRVEDTGFSSN